MLIPGLLALLSRPHVRVENPRYRNVMVFVRPFTVTVATLSQLPLP